MNSRVSWGSWLLMAVLLGSAMATSACGSEVETQHSELNLEIHNRKLDLNPAVIKVNQGDKVTLRIAADEHGTFHLHGYDIEVEVGPGEAVLMELTSDAAGSFPITFHPVSEGANSERMKKSADAKDEGKTETDAGEHEDEGEEIPIASLEVHPR